MPYLSGLRLSKTSVESTADRVQLPLYGITPVGVVCVRTLMTLFFLAFYSWPNADIYLVIGRFRVSAWFKTSMV